MQFSPTLQASTFTRAVSAIRQPSWSCTTTETDWLCTGEMVILLATRPSLHLIELTEFEFSNLKVNGTTCPKHTEVSFGTMSIPYCFINFTVAVSDATHPKLSLAKIV